MTPAWRHQTQARCMGESCGGDLIITLTTRTFACVERHGHGLGEIRDISVARETVIV